jgi:hypothetical protein
LTPANEKLILLTIVEFGPWANPTILRYNASIVKILNTQNNLLYFVCKEQSFSRIEKTLETTKTRQSYDFWICSNNSSVAVG